MTTPLKEKLNRSDRQMNIYKYRIFGSGVLNPGAVFLRFVIEAFLFFLALAGGPNPAGSIF